MSSATVSMERLFDGPGGVNTGGGITRVWENGDLLEKAGVNFSSIVGDNLPSFAAEKFKIPPGTSFHACGVRYKKILLSVSLSLSPPFSFFSSLLSSGPPFPLHFQFHNLLRAGCVSLYLSSLHYSPALSGCAVDC